MSIWKLTVKTERLEEKGAEVLKLIEKSLKDLSECRLGSHFEGTGSVVTW